MRITTYASNQQRISDLLRSQERLEQAQDRVVSGKRIQRPSDAPHEISDLLRIRSEAASLKRRIAGANSALPAMKASEVATADIAAALREVRTQALQANGPLNPEQREALADQVHRLSERLVALANTRSNGKALFAGTATDAIPFTAGLPVTYAGSPNAQQWEAADGQPFEVSVPGTRLLNARGGTDLFQNLAALEQSIRGGDSAGIASGLAELDQDLDNVVRLRGDLGARIQYMESVKTRSEDAVDAAHQSASDLENVDLAEAILEASSADAAHQATLAMAGRLGSSSLLDYLR